MSRGSNRRSIWWLALLAAAVGGPAMVLADGGGKKRRAKKPLTADHRKFAALKQNFTSGPEVTRACLSCHTEAGTQLSNKIHWTWICPKDKSKKIGKAGIVLNNF